MNEQAHPIFRDILNHWASIPEVLKRAELKETDDIVCRYCGSEDHERKDCPEYRQALADKERDEKMESARIEGPIAATINAGRM